MTAAPFQAQTRHRAPGAFTLIELLVVVSVIGVLLGILLPALGRARQTALMAREMGAGQQLMLAYQLYADDHKGMVLPGHAPGLSAIDDRGGRVTGESANRYPWRLAPYMDYNLSGLHRDEQLLRELRELDYDRYRYGVSLAPSFGLNATFLGGRASEYGPAANGQLSPTVARSLGHGWLVRSISDAPNPSGLIVFATSRNDEDFYGVQLDGFFRIDSPFFTSRRWQAEPPTETTPPGRVGSVSFRFGGKAVTALLDGHVELQDWTAMQDMRRWAPQADRPDWTLQPR